MKNKKPNGYWTYEKCKEEALKYNLKMDFRLAHPSAYNKICRNKWLDELCSHMKVSGSRQKRFIYAYEFPDNHVYVGLTFNIKDRKIKHQEKGGVFDHTKQTKLQPIFILITEQPVDVEEAIILEGSELEKYINNGWIPLNKQKPGNTGGNNLKWTFEACKKEALKYETRSEFYTNSTSAYLASAKKKWLDIICNHMRGRGEVYNGRFTLEECIDLAQNCVSRGEFKNKYKAHYNAMYRNEWRSIVFKNMPSPKIKNEYSMEICIEMCKEYESRKDLAKRNPALTTALYRRGWMSEMKKYFKN